MSPTSPRPRRTLLRATAFASLVLAATVALAPSPGVAAGTAATGATGTTATSTATTATPTPASASPAAPGAAAPAQAARLLRTALIVADVERALRFYALLGYAPEAEMGGPREPDKTAFPLNAASTNFRLVILGSPANPEARIGLVWFDGPPPAASRPPRRKVGVGDMVFVFDVADAAAIHDRLRAAGADIVETPQVYLSKQKDAAGRPYEGRVFHVFDPDGNLVELLEAAKPATR